MSKSNLETACEVGGYCKPFIGTDMPVPLFLRPGFEKPPQVAGRNSDLLLFHGYRKAAVRGVAENLAANSFVLRTDVRGYYASIDHDLLLGQLRPLIPDGRVLALIYQYLRHVIYDYGLYRDVRRGICRGCPLSPLLGALYLQALDERLAALGLF